VRLGAVGGCRLEVVLNRRRGLTCDQVADPILDRRQIEFSNLGQQGVLLVRVQLVPERQQMLLMVLGQESADALHVGSLGHSDLQVVRRWDITRKEKYFKEMSESGDKKFDTFLGLG